MLTSEPNWNLYREQFPSRYWALGEFDEKLKHLLEQKHLSQTIHKALDVGGGVLGTTILKNFVSKNHITTDLLDPFIANKPEHIHQLFNWENIGTNRTYDVIVARGSINYLTVKQIDALQKMLNHGGSLYANTFLQAPSTTLTSKEVFNINGDKGIEQSQLIENVVHHRIIFPEYDISHKFFYYSLHEYEKIFSNLTVINYGKNSALLIFKKLDKTKYNT